VPRLREVPRAEVTDEKIPFFYDRLFRTRQGSRRRSRHHPRTPGDLWTVFAQSPDVFRHAVRGFSLYRNVTLDPLLRELGQARAGYARGSQFVFSQHCSRCAPSGRRRTRSRPLRTGRSATASPHSSGPSWPTPTASSTTAAGCRTRCSRPEGPPDGSRNSAADLHHHPLRHARDHVPGPPPRIRRPAGVDRRVRDSRRSRGPRPFGRSVRRMTPRSATGRRSSRG
jgi:hypothetical protein